MALAPDHTDKPPANTYDVPVGKAFQADIPPWQPSAAAQTTMEAMRCEATERLQLGDKILISYKDKKSVYCFKGFHRRGHHQTGTLWVRLSIDKRNMSIDLNHGDVVFDGHGIVRPDRPGVELFLFPNPVRKRQLRTEAYVSDDDLQTLSD